MRANPHAILLFLLLLLIADSPLFAQQEQTKLTFSHSFPVGSAVAVDTDYKGNIFFLDQKRNIVQLDTLGDLISIFSPPVRGRVATIDAGNPLKIMAFYFDRQQILLLDRFLRPISSTSLLDFGFDGTVRAAGLASEDGFWLFNETTITLGKLDTRLRKFISETPLNLILDKERLDIRMVREYQNLVYLLDYAGGIYIFDNLGNYKKKLPVTGVSYIDFKEDVLYYVKENKLYFHNLYTSQVEVVILPDGDFKSALISSDQLFLFSDTKGYVLHL